MRNIILFIATSLDGYISRPDGGIEWLFTDQDYGNAEFAAGVDTIVMGRKTYEQSLALGNDPYRGKELLVFSRSRAGARDEHARFVAGNEKSIMDDLRLRQGRNIWLVGGAELVQAFMQYDLIDVHIISIHPIVLGGGIPLFKPPVPSARLKLVDCTTFNSGLVQMTYVRREGRP